MTEHYCELKRVTDEVEECGRIARFRFGQLRLWLCAEHYDALCRAVKRAGGRLRIGSFEIVERAGF